MIHAKRLSPVDINMAAQLRWSLHLAASFPGAARSGRCSSKRETAARSAA